MFGPNLELDSVGGWAKQRQAYIGSLTPLSRGVAGYGNYAVLENTLAVPTIRYYGDTLIKRRVCPPSQNKYTRAWSS